MPGQKATEAARREQILNAAHAVAVRRGIDGLTVRAVAARAHLSHGLVLFHFKRKDQLGLALLDRVLASTVSLQVPNDIAALPQSRDRLRALLRHEIRRFAEEPRRIRLLLEYWARGAHNAVIREKISSGLSSYRAAFRNIVADSAGEDGARPASTAAMAAAAVSLIIGFPVQTMMDPDQFNLEEYMASVQKILA